MSKKKSLIPKKIWILWFQSLSEAPFIVRKSVDSWIKQNPTWDVIVLDSDCLSKYININLILPEKKWISLSKAEQSNLIRLALLSEYGGVWADATTIAIKPLDDWIDDCCTSGFFVFYKPGRDRLISNWFIISEKGGRIVSKLYEYQRLFWLKHDFSRPTRLQRRLVSIFSRVLNRSYKTTRYWFSPLFTKVLRIYPYYVFHYLFERLISQDSDSQIIWHNTKKVSADGPHIRQRQNLFSPLNFSVKNEIDNKQIPLYKLTRKYDKNKYSPLLSYLTSEVKDQKT